MDEKKLDELQEVTDEGLESVVGGMETHFQNGMYYHYIGTTHVYDWNKSYLCPNCRRPVRYTGWGRYHCDACDETWWFERKLLVNTESGVWEKITPEEYERRMNSTGFL